MKTAEMDTAAFAPAGRSLEVFRDDVLHGLALEPKVIPCKYLYDDHGSWLFEQICELDEYYLTRTETQILESHLAEIKAICGQNCLLVEPGSGSSTKTRLLLDNLEFPAGYVPIDISSRRLFETADELGRRYPHLEVAPLSADISQPLELPALSRAPNHIVVFFPGSTIGNFDPPEAIQLLGRLRELCAPRGGILLGVDLVKPKPVLERAYNDAAGVTAAFNLNLLRRINHELQANFDLEQFEHRAIFDEWHRRIEMHLVSQCPHSARLNGATIHFRQGEFIITEHSYKYSLEDLEAFAASAGLALGPFWTDPNGWFGVCFLRA